MSRTLEVGPLGRTAINSSAPMGSATRILTEAPSTGSLLAGTSRWRQPLDGEDSGVLILTTEPGA